MFGIYTNAVHTEVVRISFRYWNLNLFMINKETKQLQIDETELYQI